MKTPQENTSKLISYWLRHNPQDAKLQVDEFGWAKFNAILNALAENNIQMNIDEIIELINSFDKIRWEIDMERNQIRATHGHSFPVLIEEKKQSPPDILYHGTAISSLSNIIKNGLQPMERQFVHLSENMETARIVAKRHGKPFVIEVDSEELVRDGWVFYKTSDNIWLTTKIHAKYLAFQPWYPIRHDGCSFIKELKREIGDRQSHFLYEHLDNLELVWNTGVCDDTLFADKITGKHYMVHLTYTTKSKEIDGYPGIDTYESFEDWLKRGLFIDQQDYYDYYYK